MKQLTTFLALLIAMSLHAQWTFNPTSLTGIQSPTNTASGDRSIAMGTSSTASGDDATSMGSGTIASDFGSLAIGHYNTTDATPNPETFDLANTAFVIGNGIQSNMRSNAFKVLFDGTTTIAGNVTATSFIGDGSALTNISHAFKFNTTSITGIESLTNTASGGGALAIGFETVASGAQSTAMGYRTTASGTSSTAMGHYTVGIGNSSTAMGSFSVASGSSSTAMGNWTEASGSYSTAMGSRTTASDFGSLAIGHYNTTDETPNPSTFDLANTAFAIGNGTNNSNRSDAMNVLFDGTTNIAGPVTATSFIGDGSGLTNLPAGFSGDYNDLSNTPLNFNTTSTTGIESPTNTASGNYSTAMGRSNTAADYGTFAIGLYNTVDMNPTPDVWKGNNTAFVIGNGTSNSNRSDAITVWFDGTTTISGDLTVNSDARLKSNIISLGSTLAKLLALDGKSYTFKRDESKQKIGLLAQDVQKVFPELVKKASDEQGTLSINYQGLIPVLINAIKEQDERIKEQDDKINRLEALVQKLIE